MLDKYIEILKKLINEFEGISVDSRGLFVIGDDLLICQQLFSKSVNLIENITSTYSYYSQEAERIIIGSKRVGGLHKNAIKMLRGHLQALLSDIEDGLLTNLEYKITAQSFLNFFEHAKSYLKQNKKMESSVIASSVFEDTIRKIGKKSGLEYEKLDRLIDELKKLQVISSTEMKKFKYFAGIRNEAMHANWDKFTIEEVEDLINGTEQTIEKYLEN
jgi:uncharacterized protein YutE (UPF0331/DUF86 family)